MKKYLLTGCAALVVVGGVAFFFVKDAGIFAGKADAAAPAEARPAPAVAVLQVAEQTVSLSRSLPGRISALRQSQVRPQVNGIITKRLFEEGAQVKKGQQLYQIDDVRYKAAVASAQADLRSAQATIASIKAKSERYAELVKIDAVSRQEYDDTVAQLDQAVAAVAVAKAAVAVAQVDLDFTKVYAPISGRIGRSLVTEGALVTANQEQSLAVITQLDPVYVDMQQSSAEAMALRQVLSQEQGRDNIPVTVMLGENAELAYPHEGSLKFSEVTIDETTGSITLRATVPNPDSILMPGLFVRASIAIGSKTAVLLPQRAATRNPDGSLSVWVVDTDNKAQSRVVEVGEAYQGNWTVTSGLQAGERVIVEGYQKVGPGAVVVPSPWGQEKAGKAGAEQAAEQAAPEVPATTEDVQASVQETQEETEPAGPDTTSE